MPVPPYGTPSPTRLGVYSAGPATTGRRSPLAVTTPPPGLDPYRTVTSPQLSPGLSFPASPSQGRYERTAIMTERDSQNQAMIARIANLEQMAKGREDNVREIQMVLDELRKAKTDLAADNSTLRRHLRTKEDALETMERQQLTVSTLVPADASRSKSPPLVPPAEGDLAQRVLFLERVNASLNSDNKSLNRSLDHLQESITSLHQGKMADASRLESLMRDVDLERRRAAALELDAAQAAEARRQAEADTQMMRHELSVLRSEREREAPREQSLTALVERLREEVECKRSENAELGRKLDDERSSVSKAREDSEYLCEALRESRASYERDVGALRAQLCELATTTARVGPLETRLQGQERLLAQEQARTRELEAELDRAGIALATKGERVAEAEADLRRRVTELREEATVAQTSLRAREADVAELRRAQHAVSAQRDDAEAAALRAQLAALKVEAAATEEALRAAREEGELSVQKAESERRQLRHDAESARAEVARLRVVADSAQEQLQVLTAQMNASPPPSADSEALAAERLRAERAIEAHVRARAEQTTLTRRIHDLVEQLHQAERRNRDLLAAAGREAADATEKPTIDLLAAAEATTDAEKRASDLEGHIARLEVEHMVMMDQRDMALCDAEMTKARVADAEDEVRQVREGELMAATVRVRREQLKAEDAAGRAVDAARELADSIAREQALLDRLNALEGAMTPRSRAASREEHERLLAERSRIVRDSWMYEAKRLCGAVGRLQRVNRSLEKDLMQAHSAGVAQVRRRSCGARAAGWVASVVVRLLWVCALVGAAAAVAFFFIDLSDSAVEGARETRRLIVSAIMPGGWEEPRNSRPSSTP
eukprot:TRINITY_DN21215_c0_g1_i1.p1 TRINITY_DN21215_c0_g1~~TRINITY_DN21215_c0_g1_i1.p1  ORF type:complete len:844 (+),score=273.56 TRINITY_DN21215_c0_g1_i1:58-2589(+)